MAHKITFVALTPENPKFKERPILALKTQRSAIGGCGYLQSSKHLQKKFTKITDVNPEAKPKILEQKDDNNFHLVE